MKIICAWCEQEGKPSLMGERAPFLDESPTHGICREHLDAYLETCGATFTADTMSSSHSVHESYAASAS